MPSLLRRTFLNYFRFSIVICGIALLAAFLPRVDSGAESWPPWGAYNPLKLLRSRPVPEGSWTFAAYGDTKGAEFHRTRTIPALLKLNPTLIINTGDVVNYGNGSGAKRKDWPAWERESHELRYRIPFFPIFGNHEFKGRGLLGLPWGNGAELYRQFYDLPEDSGGHKLYYSFVYGNVTFIALATWGDSLHPGSPQWRWLEMTLKEAKTPHIVTLTHTHIYTVGAKPDSLWEYAPEFTLLLKKYGVKLHLSGHDHIYYRTVRDGVTFVITAGGGADMYPLKHLGNAIPGDVYFTGSGKKNKDDFYYYTLFEIRGDVITGKAVSIKTGKVLDTFTVSARKQ